MRRGPLTPLVLGLAGLALGAGCATMARGTTQEVVIATEPPGAVASLADGRRCVTPCALEVARKEAVRVVLERPGCDPHTATLVPTLSGAGVALGGLPDYRTGAVYDLRPNPLVVRLACRPRPLVPGQPSATSLNGSRPAADGGVGAASDVWRRTARAWRDRPGIRAWIRLDGEEIHGQPA